MDQGLVTALMAIASGLASAPLWNAATTWWAKRHDSQERETDRLRKAHERCEEKLAALERRLEAVEHHHASLVPRWIKDASKRILWINGAAMVAIFGPLRLTRDQVEGHTFAELLDPEAAREIDRLDRSALAHHGRAVSTLLQLHAQLPAMHIVKVAGIGRDAELIYEGYAYCANDPADLADRGARREEEQLGLSLLRLGPPAAEGQQPT